MLSPMAVTGDIIEELLVPANREILYMVLGFFAVSSFTAILMKSLEPSSASEILMVHKNIQPCG
jgi:hypothetical protein